MGEHLLRRAATAIGALVLIPALGAQNPTDAPADVDIKQTYTKLC